MVGTDAGVAAALAALGDDGVDAHLEHLLGVAAGADGGHDQHAGVVAAGDRVLGRRAGEAHEPHALARRRRPTRSARSGWSARKFTPKGRSVRSLHLGDLLAQLVGRHGDGGEDAEAAGRAGRRRQPGAGHPAHPGLHDGQVAARPARRTGCAADLTPRQITGSPDGESGAIAAAMLRRWTSPHRRRRRGRRRDRRGVGRVGDGRAGRRPSSCSRPRRPPGTTPPAGRRRC